MAAAAPRRRPGFTPEIFTRAEIVELALQVAGRPAKLTRVPLGLMRVLAAPLRVFGPRVHALMDFGIAVSAVDVVAPAVGTRRLGDYFEALAGGGEAGVPSS